MRCSSSRVGELRVSNLDERWVVSYDDVSNAHPLSPLIIEAFMKKKRKYIRKAANPSTIDNIGLEAKVASDAPREIPRNRRWPEVIFTKTEVIYSDGTRSVEEKSHSVNINP